MREIMSILLMLGMAAFSLAQSEPDDPTLFQLERIELNPDTFIVTLVIKTVRQDLCYGILAHDGPPINDPTWHILQQKQAIGETLTFTDDVSGTLTHTGKTYCGFIALEPDSPSNTWVMTVNEEFVAYPILSSPQIAAKATEAENELIITYAEGIYSNNVYYSLPAEQTFGFIRMMSTNNDPANAVIQVTTNRQGFNWNSLANP